MEGSDTLEMLFGQGRFDQAEFASSMETKNSSTRYEIQLLDWRNQYYKSNLIKTRLEAQGIEYLDFIKSNLIDKIGIKI